MKLINLFQAAPAAVSISAREIAALDCIRALGARGGCCADLQDQILQHTGKEPRIATLYALLNELAAKGLIEPFESVQHEKGGRPRQVYRLTDAGRQAIALGEAILQSHAQLIPA